MSKMKNKTNSGAKKRYRLKKSGKVKRKSCKRRHLMSAKNHKAKRQLAKPTYVNDANLLQVKRLFHI